MATIPDDASSDRSTVESAGPGVDREADGSSEPVVDRATDGVPEPLSLLEDSYARRILAVLTDDPHRGRELADACEFSRPTVYRRLNRLEDAGIVDSELRIDPGGNHCKEFFIQRDAVEVTIADGSLTVTTRSTDR
ncbi:ArsR/SmtB family transcription factor [Halohasta salina]|uniref:ArsR/SmtB family transcription factor n=1 Tax=Halohasta salina TaxID=2961621 RepID=UPI0020A4AB48|nr:winged helix-turn-helix domain-containing protein [Halohasta salina]